MPLFQKVTLLSIFTKEEKVSSLISFSYGGYLTLTKVILVAFSEKQLLRIPSTDIGEGGTVDLIAVQCCTLVA